jgi:hypothetical protein
MDRVWEALWEPLISWVHYPLATGKAPLLAAYRGLTRGEKDALDRDVAEAFEAAHGELAVQAHRRHEPGQPPGILDGLSLSTDPKWCLLPTACSTFWVPAEAVMLHWAQPDSPLGQRAFGHEKEIILKPGVGHLVQRVR